MVMQCGGALLMLWKLKTLPESWTVFIHLYWAFTPSGLLKPTKTVQRLHTDYNNFIFAAEAWGKWYNAEGTTMPAKHYWLFFFKTMGLPCEKVLVWPHYWNDIDVGNNFGTGFKHFFLFFLFLPPKIFTSAGIVKQIHTGEVAIIQPGPTKVHGMTSCFHGGPEQAHDIASSASWEKNWGREYLPADKKSGKIKNQCTHSNGIQTYAHITLGTTSMLSAWGLLAQRSWPAVGKTFLPH